MIRTRFHWGRTFEHLRRYRHIMAVLMKYGFEEIVQALARRVPLIIPKRVTRARDGRTRPQSLRLAMEELGPTFIKLGQLLSTRPDLLPPDYIHELEKLQDEVAPLPFDQIRLEIERQLGASPQKLFADFDPTPLAAGSIAQVYKASTHGGEPVAIKVRRPGIVQTLRTECEILENLAGFLKSSLAPEETLDPVRMVREFTNAVMKEVDLSNEARIIKRFTQNFKDDPTVHMTRVYDEYSTAGVLTMERIEGVKPASREALLAAGLDPTVIASRGADFTLKQIFDFGLFHADPHPGNFFILPGNVLAPLDFGQVARLTSLDRLLLAELVMAIVDNDASRLALAFQRADLFSESTDPAQLAADLEDILDVYHNLPLKDIPFGRMMNQIFDLIRKHHIRAPAEFTMMLKSMVTVEALGRMLDSDFQIIDHLRPYARRLSVEQFSPQRILRQTRRSLQEAAELLVRMPEDINAILKKFKRGQIQMRVQHEHLENLIHTLDKTSNRVSFALIIAGLVVGSSILVAQREGDVLGIIRYQSLGIIGYLIAAALGLWLLVSIIRSRHV